MKAWLGLEEKEQSYMDLGGSNDAENPLTQAANSVAGAARRWHAGAGRGADLCGYQPVRRVHPTILH